MYLWGERKRKPCKGNLLDCVGASLCQPITNNYGSYIRLRQGQVATCYMNALTTNITTNTKKIHITPSILKERINAAFFKAPYFLYRMSVPIAKNNTQSAAAKTT